MLVILKLSQEKLPDAKRGKMARTSNANDKSPDQLVHYENTPIQIYHKKMKIFREKC